jgi:hypothetical protein
LGIAAVPYEEAATLWWSFPGAAKKNRTRPRPEKKTGLFEMTFTGTLIEDLMATVERAEKTAQADGALVVEALGVEALGVEPMLVEASVVEPMFVEAMFVETGFASLPENAAYDSKFLGVA